MRSTLVRVALVASVLALAPVGVRADADSDIGGDWQFRISGQRGFAALKFGRPSFGTFTVAGVGFSTLFPSEAFAVSNGSTTPATTETLSFDSRGVIHGTVALENLTQTAPLGALTILRGSMNATQDRVTLIGTLAYDGLAAKRVTLVGQRLVGATPTMNARGFDGRLTGRGVSSSKFEVHVNVGSAENTGGGTPPGIGFPFFYLRANGPARVEGTETIGPDIQGIFIVDQRGTIFGTINVGLFGTATISGHLSFGDSVTLTAPSIRVLLKLSGETGPRRLRLFANLIS